MKQNWEKEFDEKFKDFKFHHKDLCCFRDAVLENAVKMFISEKIYQVKQEERSRILKALPEDYGWSIDKNPIPSGSAEEVGFDICLKKIKDIISNKQ